MLHDLEVTRRHTIRPFKQRKPKISRASAPNPVGGEGLQLKAVFFSIREKRLAQVLVCLPSLTTGLAALRCMVGGVHVWHTWKEIPVVE